MTAFLASRTSVRTLVSDAQQPGHHPHITIMLVPIIPPTWATPTSCTCSIHRHSVEAAAKPCKTVSRDEMIGRCAGRLLEGYYRGYDSCGDSTFGICDGFPSFPCWG